MTSPKPDTMNKTHQTVLGPAVDVRIVLFTVANGALHISLTEEMDQRRLPRGEPTGGEALDAAARRILRNSTGIHEQYLEQLSTLSVDDASGWTLTVAYLGVVWRSAASDREVDSNWHDLRRHLNVGDTDRMLIHYATVRLRAKLSYTTIAFHLLPPVFTLSELQQTYEAVLDRRLDKRNFRRRFVAANVLAATGSQRRDGSHRPALLYSFRTPHDRDSYLTPPWSDEA